MLNRITKASELVASALLLPLPQQPDMHRFRQKATRRLSQAAVDELVAGYRSGLQTPELCRRFNLGKGTVLKLLHDAGVQMRRQGLAADKLGEVIALYEGGWSLQRIADRYDVSVNAVYRKLIAASVPMRDPHGRAQ